MMRVTLLLALILGMGKCEVGEIEASQAVVEELDLEDMEPESCPGIDGCLHSCPIGRVRDDEGCRMCECKENGKFEGDILVSDRDYWRLMERYDRTAPMTPPKRVKRGAMSLKESEWPRKGKIVEIPYTLHSSISGFKKQRIVEAIEEYRTRTCLRWVPRTDQKDYVEFLGLGACASHVGRIGGKQEINIGRNCENRLGTVVHEMMHAIGFWHEQARGDRDKFVLVKWSNIIPRAKVNFRKQERFWNNYGSPYDVNSVMHYGGDFFSKKKGLATMVNKKTGAVIKAQRDNFSPEDVRQINLKYECKSYMKHDRPTYKPKPVCKDTIGTTSCLKYVSKGYCKYKNFKEKCQLSCKVCKKEASEKGVASTESEVKDCTDSSKNCPTLKVRGFCTTSKKTMLKFCRKTCDLCEPEKAVISCNDGMDKCATWATRGYCTKASHKNYLKKACKKSCGHCASDVPLPEEYFDMIVKE